MTNSEARKRAQERAALVEKGRRLASERDDLIAQGVNPADLAVPLAPTIPRPSYVYVASSWRNHMQPAIVATLRAAGIDCYDFRTPAPGVPGFAWSEIDPDWQSWTAEQYVGALAHPVAVEGYRRDFEAMERADAFVLVLPCGRSAHLELGWAAGAGKRTAILTHDGEEPELMARMVDHIATSVHDLLGWLGVED